MLGVNRIHHGTIWSYDYDLMGNLNSISSTDGLNIQYVIDSKDRRIGVIENGSLAQGLLYQDALNPIAELNPDGTVRAQFIYADMGHSPSSMIREGVTYRFIRDHLGSIRYVMNASTRDIAQELGYDAFGVVTLDTNPGFQPFGYAGGIYDHRTGLVRFGARDYDASIGRWLDKDPIRFDGGFNFYGYVDGDPVNHVDPKGESATIAIRLPPILIPILIPVGVGSGPTTLEMGKQHNENIGISDEEIARIEEALKDPTLSKKERRKLNNRLKTQGKYEGRENAQKRRKDGKRKRSKRSSAVSGSNSSCE